MSSYSCDSLLDVHARSIGLSSQKGYGEARKKLVLGQVKKGKKKRSDAEILPSLCEKREGFYTFYIFKPQLFASGVGSCERCLLRKAQVL